MFRRKMIRDTILLMTMQLILDSASLMLNVFITERLGAAAVGVLSLTGSFLGFAVILSGGNAFLCTSRLISEELGKPDPAPDRVLMHGICFCMILSLTVSAVLLTCSGTVCRYFFKGADLSAAVKLMPAALVTGAVSACFKGYFNACRKASAAGAGDILEFAVRSAVVVLMTLSCGTPGREEVCRILISGAVAGNAFSFLYCIIVYMKLKIPSSGRCSSGFTEYVRYALPIMGGSLLTAALSSTNDMLIPICLRQSGDSADEALSRFGVFEAIVIPALFFPSVILCSISGMIVSESARAAASGNRERLKELASRLTEYTMIFAVSAAAVLMRFGDMIGSRLGGGELAGKMIVMISPVVPFIYMEIILEAMIKGMGYQGFSSLNYLAEYAVRISAVLIFVPFTGFYGIVISYYASNIIGNISRFVKVKRCTGARISPVRCVLLPVFYAALLTAAADIAVRAFAGR